MIPILGGGALPVLGTAAALNAGAGVGDLVQVQPGGKLPALDGSLLTGIASSSQSPRVLRLYRTSNMAVPFNSTYTAGRIPWQAARYNLTGYTQADIWLVGDGAKICAPPGATYMRFNIELPISYTGNYRNVGVQKNEADWWSRGGMNYATDHELGFSPLWPVVGGTDFFHVCLYSQDPSGTTVYAGAEPDTGCSLEVEVY